MDYSKEITSLTEENETLDYEINQLNEEINQLETQLIWNRIPIHNNQIELDYLIKILSLKYNLNNIPIFIPNHEFIDNQLKQMDTEIDNLFNLTGVKFDQVTKTQSNSNIEFELKGTIENCIQFNSNLIVLDNSVKSFKINIIGGVQNELKSMLIKNEKEYNILETFMTLSKYCQLHTERVNYFNQLKAEFSHLLSHNQLQSNLFNAFQSNLPIKVKDPMNSTTLQFECPKTHIGITISYNLEIKSPFEIIKIIRMYPSFTKQCKLIHIWAHLRFFQIFFPVNFD